MKYTMQTKQRRWPRRLIIIGVLVLLFLAGVTFWVRQVYNTNLRPVSSSQTSQRVTVAPGATVDDIATLLEKNNLIRSAWAFKLYVSSQEVRSALQAGTYDLQPSQSIPEIVTQLTRGKIATNLVTILPGQRIDQIRKRLLQDGFAGTDVDQALNPATYAGNPALVDKPEGASLEGYLYPDSFQKTDSTKATEIISESLTAMNQHLTPEIRSAFAKQKLSTYQGIVLASIVEQEVSRPEDRAQAAQVFLKRLSSDMSLGSDVTAFYGSILAGQTPSVNYDTPYNTRIHKGLPPTPISNVSDSSLRAVAYPATTDWLYFVAGDDGVTHFSHTEEEHEALTKQYCHKLCSE